MSGLEYIKYFLNDDELKIETTLLNLYFSNDIFINKGPKITEKVSFHNKRGLINKKKTGSEFCQHPQLFDDYIPVAHKSIGPQHIESDWNIYRKENNQLYVTGVSGLGLSNVKSLALIKSKDAEYNSYFNLITPIILFYFSGHNFFEVYSAAELATNELKDKLKHKNTFYSWHRYVDNIPDVIWKSSFRLAKFNSNM
jgi:hypothetical protein